jgi:hypothetical protein
MAELERVSGNIAEHLVVDCGSYQVYRSDFEDAISRACEELKIDDLKTEGQSLVNQGFRIVCIVYTITWHYQPCYHSIML